MNEYNCEVTFVDGRVVCYELDMNKANVSFWQFISDVWEEINSVILSHEIKEKIK